MSSERPDQPLTRRERRRQRIAAEIRRNREGGHRVPTWVLATALGLIVAGWIALIVVS